MGGRVWEVVGGEGRGGILVRADLDLKSAELPDRLSTGALLEEVRLEGERLQYKRLSGTGPDLGWVSLKVKGKDLVTRSDKKPPFNPYRILGIDPDATDAVIKSAFRKASVKVHPDQNPDDPEAADKFREVQHAKEFLLNPLRRRLYNIHHKLIKPVANVAWWSDWDEIFDEIPSCHDEGVVVPSARAGEDDGRIDVLIMGATGLTGTMACMLMHHKSSDRTWAIAGRDGRKLERLKEKFGSGPAFRGATRVESSDDVRDLAKRARVVCDFTGPKADIGTGMAEACVAAGTHYVEVTAEVIACKRLQQEVHDSARKAGVCVVAAGGLNCVVQDMGTWHIVKYLRDTYGVPTRRVDVYTHVTGGTVGGSSIAAGMAVDVKQVEAAIQEGGGPFFLGGARPGGARPEDEDQVESAQDEYTGRWATCGNRDPNQLHVRCTCGMLDVAQPYGERFLFKSWAVYGQKHEADMARVGLEYMKRFYKQYIKDKKVPPPGTGPRERLRQEAFATRVFVAEADEAEDPRKAYLIMNAGPGGAGDTYEGSALAVLEAALTLLDASDAGAGGGDSGLRPGYGTPAFHLAHLGFFQRLLARGFTAKVVDGPPSRDFFHNLFTSTMPIGDAPEAAVGT